MLVNRLTISKLHINGIEGTDNTSFTNVKESLTVYSLLARGFRMSLRNFARLCEKLLMADTIGFDGIFCL